MRIHCRVIVFAFALTALPPLVAGEKPAVDLRHYQPWVGSWEVSSEWNTLLGYADKKSREGAVFDHPLSFRLSLDATPGESTSTDAYRDYREKIFPKLGHTIVATGRWETAFPPELEPGVETVCFLTVREGSTYLWVGAPYAVLYGGKVSFLEGAEPRHDALVIDFNSLSPPSDLRKRTADTVGFRRTAKD